jgi:hypothetical protein
VNWDALRRKEAGWAERLLRDLPTEANDLLARPPGRMAWKLSGPARTLARAAMLLGPDQCEPYLHLFNDHLHTALFELGASTSSRDWSEWLSVLGLVNVIQCCGAVLDDEALAVEANILPRFAIGPSDLCPEDVLTVALAGLARGLDALSVDYARYLPDSPAARFVTVCAKALKGGAWTEDLARRWMELLRTFPDQLENNQLGWIHLFYAARASWVHFHGYPVEAVAVELYGEIQHGIGAPEPDLSVDRKEVSVPVHAEPALEQTAGRPAGKEIRELAVIHPVARGSIQCFPRDPADPSTAVDVGAGWVEAYGPFQEEQHRGRVTAIHPPAAPGEPARIAVTEPRGQVRMLTVRLPTKCTVPLAVGEEILVCLHVEVQGIHPITDVMIRTAAGELRIAMSQSGDPSFAPGWTVEVGPVAEVPGSGTRRAASRVLRWMMLGYRGYTAWVRGNLWRRLETPEGSWLLTGDVEEWVPGGPLPADARGHETFTILRC